MRRKAGLNLPLPAGEGFEKGEEMKHFTGKRLAWLVIALPAIFIALSALIVAAVHGEALAEKAPTAEKVLDRFVEVTGGIKAYDKIENRKTVSKLDIPAQGMTFTITMYTKRPNQTYSIIENAMIGQMKKGVSGDVVWETSIMTGPIIKEGVQRENTLRESAFERYVYWRDNFEKAELTGEETVQGIETWKVVLTPAAGETLTMFFEKESGLIRRVDTVADTEMGKIPVEAYLSDYREVDGILLTFKTTIKLLGQERVFTTESVEQNIEMPEGTFDLPEEIRAIQK
jgi:hypothetical protein